MSDFSSEETNLSLHGLSASHREDGKIYWGVRYLASTGASTSENAGNGKVM